MPSQTSTLTGLTRSAPNGVRLGVIRADLERDRCSRVNQFDALTIEIAEARAAGDDARLHVTRALAAAVATALAEVNAALRRVDEATYGICEHCKEAIPDERLEVLPTSRLCTPCQSRTESRLRGRQTRAD